MGKYGSPITRDEKIAEAARLRRTGLTEAAIGERLGVTASAVHKWLNPEKAREYIRRAEARPGRRERKTEWEREHYRTNCACGASIRRLSTRCPDCHSAFKAQQQQERREQIADLWAAGLPVRDIAQKVGVTADSMSPIMARMRAAGWELPYRRAGWRGFARKPGPPKRAARTPEQARARLGHAVAQGEVVRPDACGQCGTEGRVEGHHHDYSKPLEVEWLCGACHAERHGKVAVR